MIIKRRKCHIAGIVIVIRMIVVVMIRMISQTMELSIIQVTSYYFHFHEVAGTSAGHTEDYCVALCGHQPKGHLVSSSVRPLSSREGEGHQSTRMTKTVGNAL